MKVKVTTDQGDVFIVDHPLDRVALLVIMADDYPGSRIISMDLV